jgi:hypothetical protein
LESIVMISTNRRMIQPILRVVLALGAISPVALAQLNSSTSAVTLSATLPESVGITPSASTITWTALTPGASTGADSTLSITTAWVLASSRSSVELDASFSSASQAMANGSNYIPSSSIFGAVSGADTLSSTAFTASTTLGTAGAGLTVFSHTLTSDFNATRTDVLTLSINLNSLTIPAGVYTGTLTLQAQAL